MKEYMTVRKYLDKYSKPALTVLVLLLAVYVIKSNYKDLKQLPPPDFGYIILAALLFGIHYFIQAIGWHILLKSLGQTPKLRDSIRMYYLSMIARWMPGRIWYSATRLYIAKQIGVSVTSVVFAIVLELIYILIGGIITTLLFAGGIMHTILQSTRGQSMLVILVLVIVACSALAIRPSTLISLSRLGFFRKAVRKMAGEDLNDQNQPSLNMTNSLCLILFYALFWIYSGVMFGVLAKAFGPMNPTRWLACIPAFAGSWLIGFFSLITPAGIGVREGAMIIMLRESFGQPQSIVLSIASRLAMVLTELISAGVVFLFVKGNIRPDFSAIPQSNHTGPGSDRTEPVYVEEDTNISPALEDTSDINVNQTDSIQMPDHLSNRMQSAPVVQEQQHRSGVFYHLNHGKKHKEISKNNINALSKPISAYDIYHQLFTHTKVIISASQITELDCRKIVSQEGLPILNAALLYNGIEIAIPQLQITTMKTNEAVSHGNENISTNKQNQSRSRKNYHSKKSNLDFSISDHGVEIPKVSPYVWHINSAEDNNVDGSINSNDIYDDGQDHIAMELGS